jgi:hypothetical protein
MWVKIPNRTPEPEASPYQVQPLSRPQIERGIAMRKYAWNKPVQQIADEVGVAAETVRRVLNRQTVSDESYAKLTSYLRTPAGAAAKINNRSAKASEKSPRRALERKAAKLCAMAVDFGLKVLSRTRLAEMTVGQLTAYYWRLDCRVKERILAAYALARGYILPDVLEAWEWIERLDQLRERQTTSASARNGRTQPPPGFPGGRPSPSTNPGAGFQ